MRVRKGFDAKCYELAKAFLSDEPTLDSEESRADLAQDIQNTIEDWIEDQRQKSGVTMQEGITAGLERASSIPAAPGGTRDGKRQD